MSDEEFPAFEGLEDEPAGERHTVHWHTSATAAAVGLQDTAPVTAWNAYMCLRIIAAVPTIVPLLASVTSR